MDKSRMKSQVEVVAGSGGVTEETGLTCDPDQFRSLGLITPDAGVLAARVHVYAALRCIRIRPYAPREFGHREFCLFSSVALDELINRSEIQDPCTLIARYKLMQTNGPL